MKTKKQLGNKLEDYIVEKLLSIDKYARRSRASGASNDIGDVVNKFMIVECKYRSVKDITIKKEVWDKLCSEIPLGSSKFPALFLENKHNNRWVVLDCEMFFKLLYKLNKGEYYVK